METIHTTPNEYTSTAGDTTPVQYSGAMYTRVPIIVCVYTVDEPYSIFLATPKSVSLACQLESKRMLALEYKIE